MTDKPIPFSWPMIRALLDGRKTQTRRKVNINDHLQGKAFTGKLVNYYGDRRFGMEVLGSTHVQPVPYAPGDRLWVKEEHWAMGHWEKTGDKTKMGKPKWRFVRDWDHAVVFNRPAVIASDRAHYGWHPRLGRFMWRRDSRLTLPVKDVSVQRLQEISNDDARAEGAAHWWRESDPETRSPTTTATGMFRTLWNSIHGPDAWDENPWVCAISFDVHQCNIDQM